MKTYSNKTTLPINIDLLESQHREILSAIQRLMALPTTIDTSSEDFSLWLSNFGKLLVNHFTAEEQLMRQNGIGKSDLKSMEDDHSRLLGMQVVLLESMMRGQRQSLHHVANQFGTELMAHITDHDKKHF